jgi:hypothetical protein
VGIGKGLEALQAAFAEAGGRGGGEDRLGVLEGGGCNVENLVQTGLYYLGMIFWFVM